MASRAWMSGCLASTPTKVVTLGLTTSATFLSLEGMVMYVILIETGLALDAKVTTSQEAREEMTPVIVFPHFDEHDLFVVVVKGTLEFVIKNNNKNNNNK